MTCRAASWPRPPRAAAVGLPALSRRVVHRSSRCLGAKPSASPSNAELRQRAGINWQWGQASKAGGSEGSNHVRRGGKNTRSNLRRETPFHSSTTTGLPVRPSSCSGDLDLFPPSATSSLDVDSATPPDPRRRPASQVIRPPPLQRRLGLFPSSGDRAPCIGSSRASLPRRRSGLFPSNGDRASSPSATAAGPLLLNGDRASSPSATTGPLLPH